MVASGSYEVAKALLTIRADMSQAVNDIKKGQSQIDAILGNSAKSTSSGLNELAGSAESLLAKVGMAYGLHELVSVFDQCTESAHRFMETQVKMEAVMGIASQTVGFQSDHLRGLMTSMSAHSTASKTSLNDATMHMLVFNRIQGQTFDRAIRTANDLSVIFGSVERATMMLGKALENPAHGFMGLQRAGFFFTEQEKKKIQVLTEAGRIYEAQTFILDKLDAKTKGLMTTMMSGEFGQMKMMEKSISNLKLEIGELWMPVHKAGMEMKVSLYQTFKQIAEVLAPIVQGMHSFNKWANNLPINLMLATMGVLIFVKAIQELVVLLKWLGATNPLTLLLAGFATLLIQLEQANAQITKARSGEGAVGLDKKRWEGTPDKLLEDRRREALKKRAEAMAAQSGGGFFSSSWKGAVGFFSTEYRQQELAKMSAAAREEAIQNDKLKRLDQLQEKAAKAKTQAERDRILKEGLEGKGIKPGIENVFAHHLLGTKASVGFADLGKSIQDRVLQLENPLVGMTQRMVDQSQVQTELQRQIATNTAGTPMTKLP